MYMCHLDAHEPPCGKVSPVNTVTARPVQIGAHYHIDVYTDINNPMERRRVRFRMVWPDHK